MPQVDRPFKVDLLRNEQGSAKARSGMTVGEAKGRSQFVAVDARSRRSRNRTSGLQHRAPIAIYFRRRRAPAQTQAGTSDEGVWCRCWAPLPLLVPRTTRRRYDASLCIGQQGVVCLPASVFAANSRYTWDEIQTAAGSGLFTAGGPRRGGSSQRRAMSSRMYKETGATRNGACTSSNTVQYCLQKRASAQRFSTRVSRVSITFSPTRTSPDPETRRGSLLAAARTRA